MACTCILQIEQKTVNIRNAAKILHITVGTPSIDDEGHDICNVFNISKPVVRYLEIGLRPKIAHCKEEGSQDVWPPVKTGKVKGQKVPMIPYNNPRLTHPPTWLKMSPIPDCSFDLDLTTPKLFDPRPPANRSTAIAPRQCSRWIAIWYFV
jgi:hypothetical protein